MCGISGFFTFSRDYTQYRSYYENILRKINQVQIHRGPDEQGLYLTPCVGLAHVRLSIIDLANGRQPLLHHENGYTFPIIYNGELYNTQELRDELMELGRTFETTSDTEVILQCFLEFGPEFVKKLNGIFAFAIYNPINRELYLYRDRSGIKPLFYTIFDQQIIFSSELKGILAYPGFQPILDKHGMNEIFSIGPAKSYGTGVFKGINEVLPGNYIHCSMTEIRQSCYWKLESHPHEDTYEDTVKKTSNLVIDSIKRQMVSDVPICTFLSGGLDSSLVSAICAKELKKKGEQLNTFSFDFVDNNQYFQSSSFQPEQDRPYVDVMVSFLQSNHKYLECSVLDQTNALIDSVNARDLPVMADVDSSMLFFCSKVKKFNKVALTGECADEIFGGYPWFHKKECFEAHTFPWTMDLSTRKILLKDEFINYLDMDQYVLQAYEKSISETPILPEESSIEKRRREISYLNQKWFMQTLLDRMDRTSMYSGLEARVPFADHRILEYVFNIPWDMKTKNNIVKGLLRECGKEYLPEKILQRKKSPYPKTYDTGYEKLMTEKMQEILHDSSSPVLSFIDKKKAEQFLHAPSDYGKPWYGQLMAGPQMLAYIFQINYWLQHYHISIEWS